MNKLKLLAALVLLNAMTSPSALAYPTCTSAASDPDGDGWGWENNQSCQVSTSGSTTPTCASASSDPDGDGWGWENNASCKVSISSSGGSTSSGSTTTNPSYPVCASASSDPDGDGWGWENNASCKVSSSGSSGSGSSGSGDMYVQNGKLYSPSGNAFVPRGINLQYGDNPASALPAITPIANTGANIVRLQLRKTTTAAQLRSALDAIVAKNMVAMPMYWESDVTCQSSSSPLLTAVSSLWLGSWKSVLQDSKYRGKILLNVANEWGEDTNNYADYLSTYKSVIQSLRSGGYTMPLVIDAAHCGQYADSFLSGRGTQLLNADPKKNLVFSVHAYHWKWDTHAEIDSAITALKAQSLTFMFGEFGDSHFQAPNNIDHYYLLNKTQDESVGWIAWSWKGNGAGEEEILDMSYSYNSINLTTHGNDIVHGEDGLKQTSVLLK
jgi:mannan endo-1,4-beta-mannosidase